MRARPSSLAAGLVSRLLPLASRLATAWLIAAIAPILGVAGADVHAQARLLPQSQRITDEAIARDRALIDTWSSRAQAAGQQRQCPNTRATELMAFVSREYDLNNRDAELDSAFAQAVDLVTRLERGEPESTCVAAAPVDSAPPAPVVPPEPAPAPVAPLPELSSPDAVHFAFDRSDLGPASLQVVDRVATILQREPGLRVRLDAYTDPVGTAEWNRHLSARRGLAVQSRLVQQGVAPARITVVPHGERSSRGEGATLRERHALDRRVEVILEGEGSDRVRVVPQREDLQLAPRGYR